VNLNNALAIVRNRKKGDRTKPYFLACGCQPLHLATLLEARLFEKLGDDEICVTTGLYGDLAGSLELAASSASVGAVVVLEWSDFDPRLGLRSSGGWSNAALQDILATCQERCARMAASVAKIATRMPVVVTPPGLPRTPVGSTVAAQSGEIELALDHHLSGFLLQLARTQGVRILDRGVVSGLAAESPSLDPKMELLAGFPYTIPYASALALAIVGLMHQIPPKKGLITDLDDTFWSGIVGEAGIDGVSWDQEHHTQAHGLYQQMLGRLADMGVLLAVASKNEQSVVEKALARRDLFLKKESLFPVHANWGPKSRSVAEILRVWNIDQTAVVFIDDSPMELSEVQQAFPGVTCLQFKGKDPSKVWELLGQLRNLFGKPQVLEEDLLRASSIQAAAQMSSAGAEASSPEFLRGLAATVTLDYRKNASDKRPVDLVNKTNQFNLNGLRISEGEWLRMMERPETILSVISYEDKFGPLGKIAVAVGTRSGRVLQLSHWVMSCRAFSRRIEHHTLDSLYRECDVDEIQFNLLPTDKNQPLRDLFSSMGIIPDAEGRYLLTRAEFQARCGELPHQVAVPSE